jgi:hypothetical protein
LLLAATALGLLALGLWKLLDAVGYWVPLGVVAAAVAVYVLVRVVRRRMRRAHLRDKYGDEETVRKLMDGWVWQGQTVAQLTDSLGKPAEVDRTVLKTKIKEVWKYGHRGRNRYGVRVTLEDGVVVGWENKA